MGRRVVVVNNCQLGGVYASLAGMLPDDTIVPVMWWGTEAPELREHLPTADVLVSCMPREDSQAIIDDLGVDVELVTMPLIWFPGFHPDLTHVRLPGGGELASAAGAYNSSIVVWGRAQGFDTGRIVESFTPATFAALGYGERWAASVEACRRQFAATDLDFGEWFLPTVRTGPFMLTDNHPRFDALVQLARPVARRLGADPELVRFGWENVIPDGLLSTSVVWPVYPGVAEGLSVPGGYVWRAADGELIGLEQFVSRSLARYAESDPAAIEDHVRTVDPRFPEVLGGRIPTPVGG